MQREDFRTYIVKRDAIFPGGTDANGRFYHPFHIHNINDLLGRYPGAIGIKPGRTNRAQHTFVGAATRGGRTLVVTQLGSVKGSWKDTAALLDWGFAHAAEVTPVGRLVDPGESSPPTALTASAATSAVAPTAPVAETGTPVPRASASSWSLPGGDDPWTLWSLVAATTVVLVGAAALLARRRTRRRGSR
jgi:D-alanyl-D-alanine carboxypeptidase (penicillin-binding protein 5/6)